MAETRQLLAGAGAGVGAKELAARSGALPTPIQRHLLYALPDEVPTLRTVRLKHEGTFRTGSQWFPIEGEEYFTVAKPGFVWKATLQVEPLLRLTARDYFLAGKGNTLVKINSAITLVDSKASDEIDQSAQLRWLMETVWVPPAFVSDAIRWEAIDGHSARALLADSALPGSAVFEIDAEGKIVRVVADRYRDAGGGKSALTPCIATCGDYEAFEGFRIPARVEVSWRVAGGNNDFTWARFHLTSLDLEVQ